MKSAEEIMNMLDAFDLTGSLRVAGELSGVSHHTVARYVAARESGVAGGGVVRPMLIDEFLPKVEEWVERSNGKVRADVAHDKLLALGFTGSERTTRRAVAAVKKNYLGHAAVHARFAHGDLASILDHHAGTTTGASSPIHRAGEDGSLTQGTSGWAALGTTSEMPYDDVPEAAL